MKLKKYTISLKDGSNFIISIILIIYSILIYDIKLNKKLSSKSYKDYLTILNKIIKSYNYYKKVEFKLIIF